MPIIGKTVEDAEAKFEVAKERFSINGGLARFCGFTAVDLSGHPLDEPIEFKGEHFNNSIQGIIDNIKEIANEEDG
jgi:hypothetical protein